MANKVEYSWVSENANLWLIEQSKAWGIIDKKNVINHWLLLWLQLAKVVIVGEIDWVDEKWQVQRKWDERLNYLKEGKKIIDGR